MDISSLPEDQQQQLQKLQQLFQEHQQQQQQEEEQRKQQQQQQQIQDYASSQAYDPSQVQAYDQSYYAYYQQYQDPNQSQQHPHYPHQHQHQQQDQSQQQHNQHYEYYQADYANAYQQPSNQQPIQQQPPIQQQQPPIQQQQPIQQQHTYPESVPVSDPSESHLRQIAESGAAAVFGQQNVYYPPQQGGAVGDQHNLGVGVPPGLNPAAAAAVAALSQLTQFAGTMEAAEKAMALVGIQARGSGGFGPIMGQASGLGHFMGPGPMHHGPGSFLMQPAGQSAYRGGGRRGGGRRGGGSFRSSGNSGNRPARSSGTDPPLRSRGRSRSRGGPRRFLPKDVSSSSHPEPYAVEEAELNEEEAAVEPIGEPTADNHEEPEAQIPGSTAPTKGPPQAAWCELCRVDCTSLEILEQHKNGKKHQKNLQRVEELQNAIKPVSGVQHEQKSVSESNPEIVQGGEDNKEQTLTENLTTEVLNNVKKAGMERQREMLEQRHGRKRMMRGGRGGKRLRTDGPRRPMEPRKQPKVVIPLICDLCNVKCDTQEVFDRHVAGKKHISKHKRFEGHQAMYGPVGLQALYPPNPIAQTLFHPQGPQQAFYGPQGPYPPPGPYVSPPQGHHLAHNPNHQAPGPSSYFDGQMVTPVDQQQLALVITGNNQNGALESKVTG